MQKAVKTIVDSCVNASTFRPKFDQLPSRDYGPGYLILNDDAIKVLPMIAAKSVHLVMIDPPYGEQTQGVHDWDKAWTQRQWDTIINEVFRILAEGGHLICFSSGKFTLRMHDEIQEAYKQIRNPKPKLVHDRVIWRHFSNDSRTNHSHLFFGQYEEFTIFYREGESKCMMKAGTMHVSKLCSGHSGQTNIWEYYKDDDKLKPYDAINEFFVDNPQRTRLTSSQSLSLEN